MRPETALHVSGKIFTGWTSISITRSLESIADTFELGVTEKWGRGQRRLITAGEPCSIYHGGELVLTGYVDDAAPSYDDKSHSITVSGRSRLGDLVDCSGGGRQFTKRTLAQIATELCQPFGIEVASVVESGDTFTKHIEPGESFFEFLEKLARIRGVRLISNRFGNLVITRAGTRHVSRPLKLGGNVIRASGSLSHRDRFRDYATQSQQKGSNFMAGEQAAQVQGTARDDRITRHRPKTILVDGTGTLDDCQRLANWERNTRFGRSRGVTYTVPDWTHESGLWEPNTMVLVNDPYMGISTHELISSVNYTLDDDGTRTHLQVMDREAFELTALPDPDDDATGFGL